MRTLKQLMRNVTNWLHNRVYYFTTRVNQKVLVILCYLVLFHVSIKHQQEDLEKPSNEMD